MGQVRFRRIRPRSTGRSTITNSSRTTTSTSTSPGSRASTATPGPSTHEGTFRRAATAPISEPGAPRSGFTDMMDSAAKSMGWKPYPGPAGIRSQTYHGKAGCRYCGFSAGPVLDEREGVDERRLHPAGRENEEPQDRTMADALTIEVDDQGLASGVLYLKGSASTSSPRRSWCSPDTRTGTSACCSFRPQRRFPTGSRTITARSASTTSPTASVSGSNGLVPRQAAKPLQRHAWPVLGGRRPRRRQLRPHRPRVHRWRHGQCDQRKTGRHRELDPASVPRWGSG